MVEPLLYAGGWLLLGLILCRVAYHLGAFEDGNTADYVFAVACIIVFAPALAVLGSVTCIVYGAYRLVTFPTRAERRRHRQARADELRQHIRAEARRLGLPMLEDD
jgi:hypothetical protein